MYPVMLQVSGTACLVVGGGGVALRKVQGLVAEGADVTVVAPAVVPPLDELAGRGEIRLERRSYRAGEAAAFGLVIAATDDRAVNRTVSDDARAAGIWINAADDPELCTFHLPGRVRRKDLEVDVSSGGNAPFVVRRLRALLEGKLGPEWGEWMEAAGRFRSRVFALGLDRRGQEERFERFFAATVDPDTLKSRVPGEAEVEEWLAGQTKPGPGGPALVSLVGAGPGCAGLLTVRARRRLLEAEAVVYDRLAAQTLPPELGTEVELHCVGKTAGHHPVPQEEINELLVRLARSGKRTVRLKGGDPYVLGRGGEEAECLAEAGVPFEVIPGVTSGISGPAWAGIPVTHRGEAVRVTLLTAHECVKNDGPQVRWDLLARDEHATIVGYMGVKALPNVVARLVAAGMNPGTPAAVVERATTPAQKVVVSTLGRLVDDAGRAAVRPPALFVIGSTVRHAATLAWAARLPLAGERLLVPAAHGELIRRLEDAGAETVALPLPVTPAARVVIGALPLTGCVLASPAEVDLVDEERGGAGWSEEIRAWCVGPETAARATERGWVKVEPLEAGLAVDELAARIGARLGCVA